MPDRRLSQLLKTKLLWRSSPAAAPLSDQTVKAADPRIDLNSTTSNLSCGPPSHPVSTDEGHVKSHDFSIVSSLPVDHPSSPEDIAGPATGSSAGRDQYFTHITPSAAFSQDASGNQSPAATRTKQRRHQQEKQREQEQRQLGGNCDHRDHQHRLTPELANSPLQTSLTDESLSSPSATPTPDSLATTSFQSTYKSAREFSVHDPQFAPLPKAVANNCSGESTYQSFPPVSAFPSQKRPSIGIRRQSLFPPSQQHLISGLLGLGPLQTGAQGSSRLATANTEMILRKIWVKRPGASATLVSIMDDFLVDELRDQVIMKYSNSLGKTFDSPDLVIRISPREGSNRQSTPDRMLSPEEPLSMVIDSYYPGGQSIEEALIIEIPQRRTPKPSPRHSVYYHHSEPGEHGDYFPLMPLNVAPTPPTHPTHPTHPSVSSASVSAHPAPSISILTTGVAPPLPSPGSRTNRHRRPPLTRHTTNSPTIIGQAPTVKDPGVIPGAQPAQPVPPAIPTPPVPPPESPQTKSLTPPARGGSPRPRPSAKAKKGGNIQSVNAAFGGLIEGTVPPINVLIVEDNIINQKLLEAFMKRLSVRWKCAANGEEAVKKWRQGGFHLVLMDIQLPVMNGLDATKEIRRLERLNGIGVFPKTASEWSNAASTNPGSNEPLKEEDTLHDLSLFKSPVIIVALTASSLQSDRHEALAAGCNDFLTKPVGFPWLEQKVTEWGCMQALIDFEAWRKWRGYADDPLSSSSADSDNHARPMHVGPNSIPRKLSSISRSSDLSPSTRIVDGPPREPHLSSLPKPIRILSEESSGSGSAEALDSPASPLTSIDIGDSTDPSMDQHHQ